MKHHKRVEGLRALFKQVPDWRMNWLDLCEFFSEVNHLVNFPRSNHWGALYQFEDGDVLGCLPAEDPAALFVVQHSAAMKLHIHAIQGIIRYLNRKKIPFRRGGYHTFPDEVYPPFSPYTCALVKYRWPTTRVWVTYPGGLVHHMGVLVDGWWKAYRKACDEQPNQNL